jgi:hypothetical protein
MVIFTCNPSTQGSHAFEASMDFIVSPFQRKKGGRERKKIGK